MYIVCNCVCLPSHTLSFRLNQPHFCFSSTSLCRVYVHFHHPPSQEFGLFTFKGSRPSSGPAKGPFSSAHITCNFASRGFLTIPCIDASFIILSTIGNYVFIPVYICSMYVLSIRLKTMIIGHVFLLTAVSWHMVAIAQIPRLRNGNLK